MSFMHTTTKLPAQIHLNKCSKYPPLAITQARRCSRHWRMAASMTRWSTAQSIHAVRRYVADGLPQFSDKFFNAGLTI